MPNYDTEKLKPGYKGTFVIHDHFSSRHHWDLRLNFPSTSLKCSLGEYGGKRKPGGPEPVKKDYPDKPGNVLRSWAIPKHKLPTTKPILATETEDHAMEYGSFHGTIPEGEYGAGKVEIYDKGTYEMISVDYDKKYVFKLKGKKIDDTYALVKSSGKNFFWIKTKKYSMASMVRNISSSVIDYVRPTLNPQLWDLNNTTPKLLPGIKTDILKNLTDACEKSGLKRPFQWITGFVLSGSSACYNYKEDGDLDIDITYDEAVLRHLYPEFSKLSEQDVREYIRKAIYKANNKPVGSTGLHYSFMVLDRGDVADSEGLYDLFTDRWLRGPVKIPENFDPDKAFILQKAQAERIASEIDLLIGQIVRKVDDLKKIDLYVQHHGRLSARRVAMVMQLRGLCEELDRWHTAINQLTVMAKAGINPSYPTLALSWNWDEKQIVFKYLARSGYHRPIRMLYKLLEDDPYKKLVDSFIPD